MESLKGLFTRNAQYKLAALLIALSAWMWVQSRELHEERIRVSLVYNFPEGMVSVDPLLHGASVLARGTRAAIKRANGQDLQIELDLGKEALGRHEVVLAGLPISGLPPGLDVSGIAPDSLEIRLDKRVERVVNLSPQIVGEPAATYAVGQVVLEPAVVALQGPAERLANLKDLYTEPIDLSGLDGPVTLDTRLDLPRGVTPLETWQGTAEVQIESMMTEMTIAGVPVVVRDRRWVSAEGHESVSVTLAGPIDVLREIRMSHVVALVEMPPAASGRTATARYQASQPPRMEIVLPREDVVVVKVPPEPVVVERR